MEQKQDYKLNLYQQNSRFLTKFYNTLKKHKNRKYLHSEFNSKISRYLFNFNNNNFYIALDGPNTSGKTYFGKFLEESLKKKKLPSYYIKSLSNENPFGKIFYSRKWYMAFSTDPFLIASSTYLELLKVSLLDNSSKIILFDRYALSGKIFLSACPIRAKTDFKNEVDFWFSEFMLPRPNLQIILFNSNKDYLKRFFNRYGHKPSRREIKYHNNTQKLFSSKTKKSLKTISINTSTKTPESILSEIIRISKK